MTDLQKRVASWKRTNVTIPDRLRDLPLMNDGDRWQGIAQNNHAASPGTIWSIGVVSRQSHAVLPGHLLRLREDLLVRRDRPN